MLRKVIFIILILALFCNVQAEAGQVNGKKKNFGINFQNIALVDFIEFVSDYTGVNIIYNPKNLRGTVTIKAKKRFSKKELLDVLKTVLQLHNFDISKKENIIYVLDKRSALKLTPEYKKAEEIGEDRLSVTVFQIDNVDAKALSGFLNIVKSDIGRFVVIPNLNTIVVKDRGENIETIASIIKNLSEMGKNVMVKIFKLQYIQAAEILSSLDGFFSGLSKLNYTTARPVFMVDKTSNSLVVAALPADMVTIEKILESVDKIEESATAPRVFKLKYARAEDVEKILNKMLSGMPVTKGKAAATPGKVIVAADKATNTISVVGDPETYAKVEALLDKLDIPRDQIFVEALIIETTLEEGAKFGVEWIAGGGNNSTAGVGAFTTEGNAIDLQSPVLEGNPPNFSALPGGFSLGVLGNIITYEGVKFPTLSALVNAIKSKSGINILSKPQLLTLDNEEAEVFVGENRPYLISTKFDANNNPVQTYDYRDVGIRLKILPHLVDNDTILLSIYQEVKKVISNATTDNAAPITLTRSTNTTVKVKDNMTIVISGLIKNDESVTEKKVPLLGDIPILGYLFRATEKTSEKTNMMVFINTRIIRTRKNMQDLTNEKREIVGSAEKDRLLEKDVKDSGPPDGSINEPPANSRERETEYVFNYKPVLLNNVVSLKSNTRLQINEELFNLKTQQKVQKEPEEEPIKPMYAVQVGFFRSERNAKRLLYLLESHGYQGVVKKEPNGYRVLIGQFDSLAPASFIKRRLERKEGLEAFIYQYR